MPTVRGIIRVLNGNREVSETVAFIELKEKIISYAVEEYVYHPENYNCFNQSWLPV